MVYVYLVYLFSQLFFNEDQDDISWKITALCKVIPS